MRNYFVDTSNLFVGEKFWNYRQLCNALGEEPTTSHSKASQIRNWKRFFDWERDGWAYTITAIYGKEHA